ncbi:MAG: cysteine hydrolase [Ardenticatenaceae bacterium]|nr:cysteine hydrolase [Anaerolineales bacterium]MCB8937313.1 cysteine hydrolase [Ardenticatenaceae bacterium]MCB8975493.1 cysteine hydrolase [Ardenticatenaceae bacterium]
MQQDSFSERRTELTTPLKPQQCAILVVDMLNDFFKEGGEMVLAGGDVLYEPIERLTRAARQLKMPVFWLNQWLSPDDTLFKKRVVHCLKGTWGAKIVDDLTVADEDIIIPKRRYSGFFQTDLDLHLRERHIQQVVVTGVVTNICVRSTVNDAFFLGYDVFVPKDCVMATSDQLQESHLYDIDTHYGTVLGLDELLASLKSNVAKAG